MTRKNKQARRNKFEKRHVDQIWNDLKPQTVLFKNNNGPVGTSDKYDIMIKI